MRDVAEATQTIIAAEYNGWSNRETWTINLWFTSDESYYEELCHITEHYDTLSEQAEELERYVRSILAINISSGIMGDLLVASLGRVDWTNIAAANSPW